MVFIVWGEPIQFVHTKDEPKSLCVYVMNLIAHWMRGTLSTPPQSDAQLEPSSHSKILNESPATPGKRLQEAPSSNTLRHRFSGDRWVHDTSYMRSQGAS